MQVAKLLSEGGMPSPGKGGRYLNSNRVLDLSLSNEEKVLRQAYGANFDNQYVPSPNRQHRRNQSNRAGTNQKS